MKINQVLVESTGATVAFAFGRFNPAHQGHIAVWHTVEQAGANWFIGTNPSTLGPNDPLTFQQKSAWMTEIYPPISGHIVAEQSVLTLAAYIFKKTRKNERATVAYITDDTDWAWSGKLLNQYNGVEGAHGYYKFAQITHVPSPRVSSATALRDAARADDKVAFYHASGTDPKLKVAGLSYFDTIKQACEKYPLPVKKAKKVKEEQIDEIDRRGFLKGMGAAAIAGAAGSAMGQTQGPGYWANYAAELANNSIPKITAGAVLGAVAGMRLNKPDFEKMKTQVFEKVHKMVEAYCRITNSYNAKEIINAANSQAVKSSQADDAFNRGKFAVKFVLVYQSILEDGLEQWKTGKSSPNVQSSPVQQQEQLVTVYVDDGKRVGDVITRKSDGVKAQIVKIIGAHNEPGRKPVKTLAKIIESIEQDVNEDEQKTVAKTWDQMTPKEKISGVKGRTVWNEKTKKYYTVFDVPATVKEDEEAGEVEKTGQLIPFPSGTTKVHVSDVYDWYKLGMVISDVDDADPKMFGQGAPQTVIAFGSEEEESKLLPLLQRLGLKVDDIDPEGTDEIGEAYHAGELYEYLKKVHGKWALVSKSNPKKVLQYYRGGDEKPSDEWVNKVERRVHSFESKKK